MSRTKSLLGGNHGTRLDFYFGLTKNQQKQFNSLGHGVSLLEHVPREDILRITSNKTLIALYDSLFTLYSNVLTLETKDRTGVIQAYTKVFYVDFNQGVLVESETIKNK